MSGIYFSGGVIRNLMAIPETADHFLLVFNAIDVKPVLEKAPVWVSTEDTAASKGCTVHQNYRFV